MEPIQTTTNTLGVTPLPNDVGCGMKQLSQPSRIEFVGKISDNNSESKRSETTEVHHGDHVNDDDDESLDGGSNDDCKSSFDSKTVFLGDLPLALQGGDLTPLLALLGETVLKSVVGFKVY